MGACNWGLITQDRSYGFLKTASALCMFNTPGKLCVIPECQNVEQSPSRKTHGMPWRWIIKCSMSLCRHFTRMC